MRLHLASALRPVPDLGSHELIASQLATNGMDGNPIYKSNHIGRTIAVRQRDCIIVGKLRSVTDSATEPLLVLQIGDITTAVHPTHPVTVAPEGHLLTVTAKPKNGGVE